VGAEEVIWIESSVAELLAGEVGAEEVRLLQLRERNGYLWKERRGIIVLEAWEPELEPGPGGSYGAGSRLACYKILLSEVIAIV